MLTLINILVEKNQEQCQPPELGLAKLKSVNAANDSLVVENY